MVREDDRLVAGEQGVELGVGHAVRVLLPVGVRARAQPAVAFGDIREDLVARAAVVVEEFLRPVGPQPRLQLA
nr:hypothetical protein [Actinacidiphila soli]